MSAFIYIKKSYNQKINYYNIEKIYNVHKAFSRNTLIPLSYRMNSYYKLQLLGKKGSYVKIRNRCVLNGQGRAVFNNVSLSRMMFKHLSLMGYLNGFYKANW